MRYTLEFAETRGRPRSRCNRNHYSPYGNLRAQFRFLDLDAGGEPINTLGGGFIEAASAEPLPERAEAQTLPISLWLRANESTTLPK
jgi:hypothetical protein